MKKIYNVNDAFFKNENEASFYVAGFIAADGCLEREKNRNRYRFSIELNSKDEEHLLTIRDLMSSNAKINRRTRRDQRFAEETKQSSIRITSKEMCSDLYNFGITPNKSKTYQIPEWMFNHPLKHHFLRGIFDGDGGFCNGESSIRFYVYGTYDELDVYNQILSQECNIQKNKISTARGCSQIEYSAKAAVSKIVDFLYSDATIYLSRKRSILA